MSNFDVQKLNVYLRQIYGSNAVFREGQLEAIQAVLSGKRTLVVQKTGWGKSLIYFLSARILRDMGKGPCIIISPLLALMNNQIESAKKVNLNTVTINSQNTDEWKEIEKQIANNKADALFISPERLANQEFMTKVMDKITKNIGMLVVDEAHCISDWGHDFRPDYRRIINVIRLMPSNVPLLATTATANDRVIQDICQQFGANVHVLRGSLTRDSLYIQIIHLNRKEERLAWLIENINNLQGTGLIYCLTINDCHVVSNWLSKHGINAFAYTGQMDSENRKILETRFINNKIKVLVATVAFGMGIDKPDISFVIHFQKPGNVVAYYQQIGRAGRAIKRAYAILLVGEEDDAITQYFVNSAFPTVYEMDEVIRTISAADGITISLLSEKINLSRKRIENALKFLVINGDIYKEGSKYYKSPKAWVPDMTYGEQITLIRNDELKQMKELTILKSCYMEFIARQLNDTLAYPCGHCGNCAPEEGYPDTVSRGFVLEALEYLKGRCLEIEPRKRWPAPVEGTCIIQPQETYRSGYALSNYGDAGWGRIVSKNKYVDNCLSEELVEASYSLLEKHCKKWGVQYITSVPSRRRPNLVRDFAVLLSKRLQIPYKDSIKKTSDTAEQKIMKNGFKQFNNANSSFCVSFPLSGNVLLIDDMADSRWTLTVCSYKLIKAGAENVYVFALANTSGSGGSDL
ncbi:MAG: RecQ family ATP-dependent DNA helicase [Clostridiales bacterium]|jgi:ATP-dependent DNA helicase RecQ|nr:RecQ family ATP-dependent DNA helicase [Clostridiales bacterium]